MKSVVLNLRNLLLITVILCSYTITLGQKSVNSRSALAEKVYLQLNSTTFTTNESIWFKAIVTNAVDHKPTPLSNILYVELIDKNLTVVDRQLIKLNNGIGAGKIQLYEHLPMGKYQIRAFTNWNNNFNDDFTYKSYVQLFPVGSDKKKPINNLRIIKQKNQLLKANLSPTLLDKKHKEKLKTYITIDNKLDSVEITPSDNGYQLKYPLPKECQYITLKIATQNKRHFSETIIADPDNIAIQFFPESGELVNGLWGNIGFKALTPDGRGIKVEGQIVDQNNNIITNFQSNQLGMGSFTIGKVDKKLEYYAQIKSAANNKQLLLYPLPPIADKGTILSVHASNQYIIADTESNILNNDSIQLKIASRGITKMQLKTNVQNGESSIRINKADLPYGIVAFTLFDNKQQPIAERLFFNKNGKAKELNIQISSNQSRYLQREQTECKIEITNSKGKAAQANLSMMVINKEHLAHIENNRNNLVSHLILSSELKGEIENPYFYLTNHSNKINHLDALMLTQGWRKYNYSKPDQTPTFIAEKHLTLSGTVRLMLNKKRTKRGARLSLATFGKDQSFYSTKSDTIGRFCFALNDEYGGKINAMMQSRNRSRRERTYDIVWDKKKSPTKSFNLKKNISVPSYKIQRLVDEKRKRKNLEDQYLLPDSDIKIDEVVVTSEELTPIRKKMNDLHGEPDNIITGEELQENETNYTYGLFSILLYKFPHRIYVSPKIINGVSALIPQVGNGLPTFFVVDGVTVDLNKDIDILSTMSPKVIASFEIIHDAPAVADVAFQIGDTTNRGNIIAIYTNNGQGLYGNIPPRGVDRKQVEVFSPPCEYYTPKYPKLDNDSWYKPDLRAMIEWQPLLNTQKQGTCTTSFYNADQTGQMIIVVEAISKDGEIGYQQFTYNVEHREDVAKE